MFQTLIDGLLQSHNFTSLKTVRLVGRKSFDGGRGQRIRFSEPSIRYCNLHWKTGGDTALAVNRKR